MKHFATEGIKALGDEFSEADKPVLWLWPRDGIPRKPPLPQGVLHTADLPSMTVFEGGPDGKIKGPKPSRMDPFEFIRYASISGMHAEDYEDFEVHWSQSYSLKDRLPWFMTGKVPKGTKASRKIISAGRVMFKEIPYVGQILYLFQNYTFWGRSVRPQWDPNVKAYDFSNRNRLVNFLTRGLWIAEEPHHPQSTAQKPVSWWYMRPNEYWRSRLIGNLQTTESLMNQFMLGFPDFNWNWELYDACAWHNLNHLCLSESGKSSPMTDKDFAKINYVVLKQIRKRIKLIAHTDFNFNILAEDLPYAFNWMKPFLQRLTGAPFRHNLYTSLIICQTRATSLPPFEMGRRSLSKWIGVVTTESEELPPQLARHIKLALLSVHRKIDGTGLREELKTSANLEMSATAALGVTREELGKLEAVARILSLDMEIPTRDLRSGETTGLIKHDGQNTGTYLFWYSIWFCSTHPDKASEIEVFAVNEQGKSRIVSKSHVCVTILLFGLSTVAQNWVARVPSSRAGMTSANDLWQLYQRLSPDNPAADFIWSIQNEDKSKQIETYSSIWAVSTDMEQATDFGCWNRGRVLLGTLCCTILGMGKWYIGLCLRFLCGERIAHVQHYSMGLDGKVETQPYTIRTKRGWLMGDPGTKILLHCTNIVARELGAIMAEELSVDSSTDETSA
jgi:hypothetical protein